MRFWLIEIGEPTPLDEAAHDRLHRVGLLSHYLAQRGHDVVWWTSTFDHGRKRHWRTQDTTLALKPNLELRLLHSCGYSRNVSLSRLRDHRQMARSFAAAARQQAQMPDAILCSLPAIELAYEAARFGQQRQTPTAIDVRDLWPDIFPDVLPALLRPLGHLALWPMYRQSRLALRAATAIVGVTDEFLQWGLRRAGRTQQPLDRSFGFAYAPTPPSSEELAAAHAFWQAQGVGRAPDEFLVCFFGRLGYQFNLTPVFDAARRLASRRIPVRFIICGSGDRMQEFQAEAADAPNVLFPGWVNAAQIWALMERSVVGLSPYRETPNFTWNIPNKPVEYMAGGLVNALSLKGGVLRRLIEREECGFCYDQHGAMLADRLAQLYDHPPRRQQMADNGLRVYREQFHPEQVHQAFERYLCDLAAARPASTKAAGR